MHFNEVIILLFASAIKALFLFLKSSSTLAEWSHGPYFMFPRNI